VIESENIELVGVLLADTINSSYVVPFDVCLVRVPCQAKSDKLDHTSTKWRERICVSEGEGAQSIHCSLLLV